MPLREADTRAKLIDPALHQRGWTEDLIRREESAGTVYIVGGQPRRQASGRVDYTLRLPVETGSQPVAVALIEAKAEQYPPTHGLEQAKLYASSRRLHVPFVYSSNGHQFVEFDSTTGLTTSPKPITSFPSPSELRQRYETIKGFSLDSEEAKPLARPYAGGDTERRYYQDAAIRAALEKIAAGDNRVLLSMATGSGKTRIAVYLLRKIADTGQLRRALFVCDRQELREQASGALQASFGNNAAEASTGNPQLNARVVVATYQTLGVDTDDGEASFLTTHYPPNYFSHIIIDEAHRSAWGKWSEVLTRNSEAVQIGLTATPRELEYPDDLPDAQADREITANNRKYFGEPVYEYSIGQGIEDGYLALMELHKNDIFLNQFTETEEVTGLRQQDLENKELTEVGTGRLVSVSETRGRYEARSFERALSIPQRDHQMCCSLFLHLLATGGPEQKTIIFCASDSHADNISTGMNNLYVQWCASEARIRVQPYAFKCTAASGGNNFLPDFRGSSAHHFIATTVDLLSTGVDVPCVNNIVFFRYLNSPITLYQMVGRGTRLHPQTNKLMFRVYDYTDATRLFGEDFKTAFSPDQPPDEEAPADNNQDEGEEARGHRPMPLLVHGIDVRITDAGTYIMTTGDDGQPPAPVLGGIQGALSLQAGGRHPSLGRLPHHMGRPGTAPRDDGTPARRRPCPVDRARTDPNGGLRPLRRAGRRWLRPSTQDPRGPGRCLRVQAPVMDFRHAPPYGQHRPRHRLPVCQGRHRQPGELPDFSTPEVAAAGGLRALRDYGEPRTVVDETKRRMFAA